MASKTISLYLKVHHSELIGLAIITTIAVSLNGLGKVFPASGRSLPSRVVETRQIKYSNVHEKYYADNWQLLEERFPERKTNEPFVYIKQVFCVFGGAIIMMLAISRKIRFEKSFSQVTSWDVTALCCILNLIFAYAFGFTAVVNDWWFFFPDLITGIIWQIRNGQMVLGDVLFYPFATVMGHLAVILTLRMKDPLNNSRLDALLKAVWFTILFTVALFAIIFGSTVMQGMVKWLYFPFGLAGLIFYRKFTAFQLWSTTLLFVICEFLWDVVSRVKGIWIFPDYTTHPGLYCKEILLFRIGDFPVIWQPEMTQMAFVSGLICIVFFHTARYLLNKK